MRAATHKADHALREPGAFPGTEPVPGPIAPDRMPEEGRGPGASYFTDALPRPANDSRASRAPLPPLLLGWLVAALDALAIGGAGLAADALANSDGARHGSVIALVAALTLGFGVQFGAYAHPTLFRAVRQARRMLAALAAAFAAMLLTALTLDAAWRLDAAWLAFAAPLSALSLVAGRAAVGGLLRHEAHGRAARRTVILGAGAQTDRLVETLRRHGPGEMRILGLVDERGPRADASPPGVTDLGGLPVLCNMIRRGEVDMVLVSVPGNAEARVADLLNRLSCYPVEVRLAPDLVAQDVLRRDAMPLLLRPLPICGWGAVLKRAEDILLALAAMAVAAVPMLLIALAIRLDSPGPVFFRQRRTGFNDRPFHVLKFRTMYAEASDHEALRQVQKGDPRVTRIGAILRRTSLDELPQILNVLRGEMSFVGPRPHAPNTRAGSRRFEEVVQNYAARHCVKPGLTGLAQVRGYRGPTTTEDQLVLRVDSDLEYIRNWSLRLDMVIILRTMIEVARMRNAV